MTRVQSDLLGDSGSDPAVRDIVNGGPAFDMHSHLGRFFSEEGDPATPVAEMRKGGVVGCVVSAIADLPVLDRTIHGLKATRTPRPGELFAATSGQLDRLDESLHRHNVILAKSARAIREAAASDQIAMVAGIEGADFLERDIGGVEWAHGRGVRLIQLVHYRINAVGDIQTEAPRFGGLTDFGAEVISEMDRLGMVIDLAHATFRVTENVASRTRNPIVISHTMLGDKHPRMIGPDHARLVADTGGIIGVWPSTLVVESFEEYVDGIMRLIDLIGVDAVGIGTDHGSMREPVLGGYARFDRLAKALLDRELSAEDAGKVLGGNFVRVFERVVGGPFLRSFEDIVAG